MVGSVTWSGDGASLLDDVGLDTALVKVRHTRTLAGASLDHPLSLQVFEVTVR